ncbi:hypothetical protein WOLCODRAFT_20614 [Wolfiporia cocos MD-104 SS10]|uniref:Uncharacterized protein n=1 Tax=Wolfiporia cocos (strain MD-104) TaxID=742152 RepID=A0A2H3JKN8_WOLCO|nr:hypothetical protein WOLCODRAFT_20614 [Wolfiporia cocos MD-104 SS10]
MPIKTSLQCILMRSGKYDELQKWRTENDQPGRVAPSDLRGMDAFPDPTVPLTDICDGWGWRAIQAGLEHRRGGKWGIEDADVHQIHQRFVSLPCGIVLIFNIDWFGSKKKTYHSSGAIYLSICNNPHSKRFLRDETMIFCVIPGPNEPSLEQLNNILEPMVRELLELGNGQLFKLSGMRERELVHVSLYAGVNDLPASRKAYGLRGYGFIARNANNEAHEEIAERRGVCWSILTALPDWHPARDTPPDFMHGCFLGETKHLFQEILLASGMFTKRDCNHKPLKWLEEFLRSIWWPSTAGRIAAGGSVKADQWRNLLAIPPVALYVAWEVDGDIPDADAPWPRPSTNAGKYLQHQEELLQERRLKFYATSPERAAPSTIDRNYVRHYTNAIELCVAIRIWASRTITPEESMRAHASHSHACKSWCRMGCHLTLYFHISCHFHDAILRLGPVYGWWTYPFERNNGFLAKFSHNGHSGGELEATLMRGWVKSQLLHDLIRHIESLGPKKTADDVDMLGKLKKVVEGDTNPTRRRGTLLNMIGSMMAHERGDRIQFPHYSKKINLRCVGIYGLILRHPQDLWSADVQLVPDSASVQDGEPFVALSTPSVSHVFVDGLRYGVSTSHRGIGCSYAYIDGRTPVRIDYLLRVEHFCRDPTLPPLRLDCAVVRRFVSDPSIPAMPWNIWSVFATDLGISTWLAGRLSSPEVIDVCQFSGHFALATVHRNNHNLWITMSICHDSQEPDIQVDEVRNDQQ